MVFVGKVNIGRKGYCPSFRGEGAQSAQSFRHAGRGSQVGVGGDDEAEAEEGDDVRYSIVIGVAEER